MKRIKDLNKQKDIPHSWTGQLNTNISPLPMLICEFNTILSKFQQNFFVGIDKIILKFTWEYHCEKGE